MSVQCSIEHHNQGDEMVNLTAREQNFLAEFCSVLRGWRYQSMASTRSMDGAELDDRLTNIAERFDITPQQLDDLYDVFNRTGHNA